MKPFSCMTYSQRKKIDWICELLDIKYTGGPSSADAWKFIDEHIMDADRVHRNMLSHKVSVVYVGNPLTGTE